MVTAEDEQVGDVNVISSVRCSFLSIYRRSVNEEDDGSGDKG